MSQSKRHSLFEALTNVMSGMVIAFAVSQLAHHYQDEIREYIWEGFTWQLSVSSNIIMTIVLTVISVIRGYIWRRIFNKIQRNSYEKYNG